MGEVIEVGPADWCCTDCVMILANDEDCPEWTAVEAGDHRARMAACIGDYQVVLGLPAGEHECGGRGDGCECDFVECSPVRCATCGTSTHGDRHAVVFLTVTHDRIQSADISESWVLVA